MSSNGWIGVDLDGVLAHYDGWKGPDHIGEPVPRMMERVRQWIAEGRAVKIFTARAATPEQHARVRTWLTQHGLGDLEVTNVKDSRMIELWDDRCVQVERNSGNPVDLFVAGEYVCDACEFVLHRRTLYARNGSIGATHEPPELCPNDETPLRRVTWRELADQYYEAWKEAIERLRLMEVEDGGSQPN